MQAHVQFCHYVQILEITAIVCRLWGSTWSWKCVGLKCYSPLYTFINCLHLLLTVNCSGWVTCDDYWYFMWHLCHVTTLDKKKSPNCNYRLVFQTVWLFVFCCFVFLTFSCFTVLMIKNFNCTFLRHIHQSWCQPIYPINSNLFSLQQQQWMQVVGH